MQLLKTQLLLKGVIGAEDWKGMKEKITFDYIEDNYFSELKESEMIRERFEMLSTLDEYIGTYVSNAWVRKHILRFNEDEIEAMQKEIDAEKKQGDTFEPDPDDPRFG